MSCCGRGWRSPALWPAGGCADGRRDLAGDGSSLWREACLHDLGRGSILVLRCPAPGRAATRETCRPTRPETGAERCRAARCHPPRPGPLAMDRRGAPQGLGPPAGDRRHPGQPTRVLRIMGEYRTRFFGHKAALAARLSEWRDRALLAAEAALKERERDDRDDEIVRLKGKVGEMTMETELLREKIARLEAGAPLARRRSRL